LDVVSKFHQSADPHSAEESKTPESFEKLSQNHITNVDARIISPIHLDLDEADNINIRVPHAFS